MQDFLRRQLRQSATVYHSDPDEGRVVAFSGEGDELRAVTPMLAYLGFGGLYWVHYDMVDDGDAHALRLRWWPYQPEGEREASEDTEESLLLRGVDNIQFSYFGADEPDEDPQWRDQWENIRFRPQLVRLTLDWAEADWPPLVVGLISN